MLYKPCIYLLPSGKAYRRFFPHFPKRGLHYQFPGFRDIYLLRVTHLQPDQRRVCTGVHDKVVLHPRAVAVDHPVNARVHLLKHHPAKGVHTRDAIGAMSMVKILEIFTLFLFPDLRGRVGACQGKCKAVRAGFHLVTQRILQPEVLHPARVVAVTFRVFRPGKLVMDTGGRQEYFSAFAMCGKQDIGTEVALHVCHLPPVFGKQQATFRHPAAHQLRRRGRG